jgi:hypothetical protein
LGRDILDNDLKAFPLVVTAPNLTVAISTLVQGFGVGPLQANTVLLNWLEELPQGMLRFREMRYGKNLRTAFRLGANLVILRVGEDGWPAFVEEIAPGRIDVWWRHDPTGRLMLLLAYLLTRSETWGDSQIRILASAEGRPREEALAQLTTTLEEARIRADPEVLDPFNRDALVTASRDADLLFLPFRIKGGRLVDPFDAPVEEILPDLPATAMVLAAEDVDLEAEPEEGTAGEWAQAMDALSDARKRAEETREEAEAASEKARKRMDQMESAIAEGADDGLMALVKEALEAKTFADKASRRAAKALAKAELAEREARDLGVQLPEEDQKEAKDEEPGSGS